jgi:uncharacterized delta-60 repeat protein
VVQLFGRLLAVLVLCATFTTHAAPGNLDTTFGSGTGKVISAIGSGEDTARALAVQPDGKIVVAGSCSNGSDDDLCIARYNANGTLDATFGSGGKVLTMVGEYGDNAYALAVQPDGKIVVAGSCYDLSYEFCLARYSANGVLDATFGIDGKVITAATILEDSANALTIQPDGKLVVAGHCYHGGIGTDFCLARYSANGELDATFGSAGLVFTDLSTYDDKARALVVQSDGKILVAGSCPDSFCLARYNANGVLDATFGSSGTVIAFSGSSNGHVLALQHDGRIVVAGECYAVGWDFCLARFSANGALDPSFGSSGKVATPMGSGNDYVRALALQPDGKIVVAGHCVNGSNTNFCLARYSASGALDTSFNTTGKVFSPIVASDSVATALALQPDGKIVVAGYCSNGSNNDFCVARYEGGPFDSRNCSMDIDGDNRVLATTDMLIGARVALGLTGNAVIGGITFAGHATRTTWPAIRDYLVSQCGMSVAP